MKLSHTLSIASAILFASFPLTAVQTPGPGGVAPAGPATLALYWRDTSTDETGFRIERQNGASWEEVSTVPADRTYFYHRGLAEESTHTYRVSAITSSSASSPRDLGSATTLPKMNILFFLADDMGFKDIVALRNPDIDGPTLHETPALDALTAESVRFLNAYCSGPRCVVARRSMQTGTYDWDPAVVPPNDYYLDHTGAPIGGGLYAGGITLAGSKLGAGITIPDNETYGEALQAAGYRTAFLGKYHLGESPSDTPVPGYTFGDQPPRGPDAQGYDVSIGAGHAGAPPASYFAVENQHAPGTYTFELPDLDDANFGTAAPVAGEYITDRLTDKAIGFMQDSITNHPAQPFHLTLAHYAVHTPMEAQTNAKAPDGKGIEYFQTKKAGMTAEFAAHPAGTATVDDTTSRVRMTQNNAVYAAMMKSYDQSLADLRAYLTQTDDPRSPGKKLSETTIIVVSSDHGGKSTVPLADNKDLEDDATDPFNPSPTYDPPSGTYKSGLPNAYSSYPTSNYPFRYGKTWVYEGGLKVPLIVHIPGYTLPGAASEAFVHHADLFASFVDMAGGGPSAEARDSVSFMLPALEPDQPARTELFHFFTNANKGTGNPAIGAYRLGETKLLYFMVQRRVELYNLAADPYEQNDLSATRPDLAAEMLDRLYQEVLSSGFSMPRPGSNTWLSEQNDVLVRNGLISGLPPIPDAAPSDLVLTELSPRTVQLDWTVNASNATHSVIYRRSDAEGDTGYQEHAFVPAGVTTFIDDNLEAGTRYRYRVESENLGGWATANTGNQSITLSSSGTPLPLSVEDDSVTTVPGETRMLNPLLNDRGEGALTITGITVPTSGSAVVEKNRIAYTAPESFSGPVTMSYSVEDTAGQTGTGSITFTLPVAPDPEAVDRWDFDETAGTQVENTLSASGIGFNGSTSASILTTGTGRLRLTEDSTLYNRISDALPGGARSEGRLSLRFSVPSLDVSTADNSTAVGFSFRDGDGNDFGILRLRTNAGSLVAEIRVSNANERIYTFPATTASDVVLEMTLDLDASPRTLTGRVSIAGTEAGTLTVDADPAPADAAFVRLQANINSSGAFFIELDDLEISAQEAAPDLYSAWSSHFSWEGIRETAEEEDADLDGLSNAAEFALGSNPTVADVSPVSLAMQGNTQALTFTPQRDTDSVTYLVEQTTDVSDWEQLPAIPVTVPAGTPVSVPMPDAPQGFSRVRIEL